MPQQQEDKIIYIGCKQKCSWKKSSLEKYFWMNSVHQYFKEEKEKNKKSTLWKITEKIETKYFKYILKYNL